MRKDTWNPDQYQKYAYERSQPFFDLAALLKQTSTENTLLDLGCGSGELTVQLPQILNIKSVLGIDNSEAMLNKAFPLQNEKVRFKKSDMQNIRNLGSFDVILANASVQWCDDQPWILNEITQTLNPGGQIAIQMPMNHDYPTHILATTMSGESKWLARLGKSYRMGEILLSPEKYADLLFRLGFKEQLVMQRVYAHIMPSREDVLDWVKGSLFTFFESRLSSEDFKEFTEEYRERLFAVLANEKPFFYPFKRIFLWAKL